MIARAFKQRALQIPLLAFVLSRLWVALFVYLGHAQHAYLAPVPGGWEGVPNWWLNPWTIYDSKHFIDIALHGYDERTAAFFPLYPLLLKIAGSNPIWVAAWGIALSNMAFLGALLILYRLTEREYSAPIAGMATWILAFFPTSVIFSAVYTESLFLFLIVAAFWFLRQNLWLRASLFVLLASLTRNIGPLLFLALFAEWLWRRKEFQSRERWISLLPVAAPLLGFIAVQFYLQRETGIWMASVAGQKNFGMGSRTATWPWNPLLHDIQSLFAANGFYLLTFLNLAACLLVFFLLLRHGRKQPISYSLWLGGTVMLHLIYTTGREAQTIDALRYLSPIFPFTQLLALDFQFLRKSRLQLMYGMVILLMISGVLCYSFGQKSYVG